MNGTIEHYTELCKVLLFYGISPLAPFGESWKDSSSLRKIFDQFFGPEMHGAPPVCCKEDLIVVFSFILCCSHMCSGGYIELHRTTGDIVVLYHHTENIYHGDGYETYHHLHSQHIHFCVIEMFHRRF